MIRGHKVTKTALGVPLLVALRLISDNHERCILVTLDMCASINPCLPDYTRKILANMQFISCHIHLEDEPVENLLAINEGLVYPNLHNGFPLEMSGIAYSYIVPVGACLIEHIVNILNSVIQVDSKKGIRDSKA